MLTMRKVLIITGDGGESYETLYAIHRIREEGYEAVVAAPAKRRLHLVMHDFEPGWDTYIENQATVSPQISPSRTPAPPISTPSL